MATIDLENHFLAATEAAAIAASWWRGKGDGKAADGAAVEAMRKVFDEVPFDGRVAIGEGERDDAPMLWIGEPLGSMQGDPNALQIDIAVDPLECTNHVAKDLPNAMAVLAAAPRGALLHAPDCYMNKIAGPAELNGVISLDASTSYNVEAAASALGKKQSELNIVVMDRPRHETLISELNAHNVNVILIGDGDVSAALNAADPKSEIDMLMGIGAAPEGVITATALRGLGAPFEGRLVFKNEGHRERAEQMIDGDVDRLWDRDELCSSDDSMFIGTGVCPGRTFGVEELSDGRFSVQSEVIDVASGAHRFIDSIRRA
ncbi:MAG TPA: class II fructose-bisphosphatase [Candidatus Thalassarchaeaceae archaeon]|jgi:fructose-1,6-bisphosphatase class II|nr:class II fructose-bisphosphatase [Candidatus Thalassarchaeaceae archaeon]MDP7658774.1 class II fructose-bisphosphatase [Candidatus Thalassarchaeaceae archaeon]HJL64075.1 class II fructose-bisphosphatase [Candidatus Thalassarchaeaceae archaeon]HJO41889.1 class II fructose-bisphosphatase [Candidatus Thalassarchaeaceae archaeon]